MFYITTIHFLVFFKLKWGPHMACWLRVGHSWFWLWFIFSRQIVDGILYIRHPITQFSHEEAEIPFREILLFNSPWCRLCQNKDDLWASLIFCYHLKKTPFGAHQMLVEVFGDHTLGHTALWRDSKHFNRIILTWRTKPVEVRPKSLKINYKFYWMKSNDDQTQQQLADQLGIN